MTAAVPSVPPLAGLCSFDEARRAALSVEDCVTWMKRHHYVLSRLHGIFTARLTAESLYELKTAFSHHAYLCAEHVTAYRKRVSELREPPLGLEAVPHDALRLCCDEVLCAPTTVALLVGLYEVLVPALIESLDRYVATTNPLADAPSVRVARFCRLEMEELRRFGERAIAAVVTEGDRASLADWVALLHDALAAAGGLHGRDAAPDPPAGLTPRFSATPYVYDPVPKRDARFRDSYNAGVNPEAFLYDERFAPRDKVLMMYYKRLRELDVPEMMASVLHETPGKPWKFYADMSRQLWDEARHSMLGEVGFVDLGLDWSMIPVNFTWSLNLNTQLTPRERHAVLFFIEQGLMPRTGKRYEWEVAQASGMPLAALIQDFDWADEVLHAQLGREWYVADFGDLKPAMDYGDRCWSKVMSHWREYRDRGLTGHRNWWPDLYRAACERWGIDPDPEALAFHETYEEKRADLKAISASG
ncbi:MAG TPA: hypothetical protein VF170_19430 [Planctomycetaceae bacterium]